MPEDRPPTRPGADVFPVGHDAEWSTHFARQEARIRGALRPAAVEVHHVGSTSVPDLAAKPVIDVVLVVADPADEPAYVPPLEQAGYILHLREPEWYEHRLLKHESPRVNLHVLGPACPEVTRMLAFRDHLRRDQADRELYERAKHRLAARPWARVQDYADAKSDVITEIMGRALR